MERLLDRQLDDLSFTLDFKQLVGAMESMV
jgi:hypothetical protein